MTRPILAGIILTALCVSALMLRVHRSGFGSGEVRIDHRIVVSVRIANNDQTRKRGLSGVSYLAPNEGMFFVLHQPRQWIFWMNDMRIPIDALWIRDGIIVDISPNLQPPDSGEEMVFFSPIEPADSVLEVPAGFSEQHGLRLGLPVDIRIDRYGLLR